MEGNNISEYNKELAESSGAKKPPTVDPSYEETSFTVDTDNALPNAESHDLNTSGGEDLPHSGFVPASNLVTTRLEEEWLN